MAQAAPIVRDGFRPTKPRDPDAQPVTSTYTSLARTVRDAGLLGRAHRYYAWTVAALTVALGGIVTGIVLLGDSWFQLLMAAALGLVLTQFAFIAHEAAHRQVLESGRRNDQLGRFVANAVVGISYSWWMNKHTRHHANPNRVDKDPDIENDTIAFTEEGVRKHRGIKRWINRYQGWLFFPLLTLEGLNLHLTSIQSLFHGKPGTLRARVRELVTIAVRLSAYVTVLFLVLPVGMAFAFLGVQMAVFGVYMGASFAPNHKGMPVIAPDAKLDFFTKQVRTSRNIRGGWWATWLMGGLNYQIEHHLFPNMPRPALARAREIVIEQCRTLDVPYTETSLLRSYAIVIDYLNRVGLAARDPFDCPVVSNYRRA